jgi:colanic acid/amylovoran biosynthesis glycosyltransferase
LSRTATALLPAEAAASDAAGVDAERARIAFLVETFPVVSETFVVEQAAALVESGWDLEILATRGVDPAAAARFPAIGRLGLMDRVVGPGYAQSTLGGLWARPALAPRLAATALLPRNERLPTLRAAAAFAAAGPFDLIHCQFGTLGLAALRHARLGSLRARRLVVHLRGYDITKFVAERGTGVYDELFRTAHHVIANCEHFRQRAIALGCDPGRVSVIGSPIDTGRFVPPASRPAPAGRPFRIAAIGRLVEKKGFADLVRAVAQLAGSGRRVTLEILGDGPLRDPLASLARDLGAVGAVALPGAGSHDDVLALLHRSDVLVAPSVRAASGDEDAPVNTLKEALATELPVVATRHGGIPELVEDGVTGLLVPERDPEALSAAIARMMDASANIRAGFGRAGRRKVVGMYGRETILRRTTCLYETLLEREP